jgi:hypothetical protein
MPALKFTCPHCSQHLEAPDETAGRIVSCPACAKSFPIPGPAVLQMAQMAPGRADAGPVCAICLSPFGAAEARTSCSTCNTEYHTDCWQENGGCAVYGCSQVPTVEQRRSIEVPVSYWGQENKLCPGCGREILAAAVRCRYCGATFDSARPQDSDEFRQKTELAQRLPLARRLIVGIFVFSLLPCLAPIGAIWGLIWYSSNREELRALPSLYSALCKIGLVVSFGQTVAMMVLTLAYLALHH